MFDSYPIVSRLLQFCSKFAAIKSRQRDAYRLRFIGREHECKIDVANCLRLNIQRSTDSGRE